MDNEEAKYTNPIAEQEHKIVPEMTQEDLDFLKDVEWQGVEINDDQWLDINAPYFRPDYTLSYKGIAFAPLGGIHALTGQPGHGKTATFSMFIATLLGGEYGELKCEISNPSVLYVDTEMEKCNTILVAKRICEMVGKSAEELKEHLRVLRLRDELKAENRWRKILKAIWCVRPKAVFIDGIIDITQDFNDNKECQELIYQIMDTATQYNISLWCLLHQNPGSTKMVGHAGSFLERKATDVFMTKKDKESGTPSFQISQIKARGRDVSDIFFTIEDDEHHYGIPRITNLDKLTENDNTKETQREPTPEDVEDAVSVIGTKTLSYFALREAIKEAKGIGSTKAKDLIMRACNLGYLTVANNKYTANPTDRFYSADNDLPF